MRVSIVDIEGDAASVDERGASVEAQEAANLQLYEQALLQHATNPAEAAASYAQLLAQPIVAEAMAEARVAADAGELVRRPSLQLKFLALKNLALLEADRGEPGRAVGLLLQAVQIHCRDAVLWQRLGVLAGRTAQLQLARHALEQAVACSPSFQLARLQLAKLLHGLGDEVAVRQLTGAVVRIRPAADLALMDASDAAAGAAAAPPPAVAAEVYEVEDMDGDINAEYTPLAAGGASMAAAGLPASSPPQGLAGGANGAAAAAAAGEQDVNFLIEEID